MIIGFRSKNNAGSMQGQCACAQVEAVVECLKLEKETRLLKFVLLSRLLEAIAMGALSITVIHDELLK